MAVEPFVVAHTSDISIFYGMIDGLNKLGLLFRRYSTLELNVIIIPFAAAGNGVHVLCNIWAKIKQIIVPGSGQNIIIMILIIIFGTATQN